MGAEPVLKARSVETVLTWEDIEFLIVNRRKAEITHLVLANHDVLVLLLPLLLSLQLSVLCVILKLPLEADNPVLVLTETLTEMLLHVLNLLIGRNQRQEVV